MADIAAIFGWSPDVMAPMSLTELLDWHDRAVARVAVRFGPVARGGDA